VPPRKKTSSRPPALTADDVTGLRAQVTAGDKPRVIVRAASAAVPAGTRGNVIRMGNPSEGEFIVVRLGRDEVPFAPAELALSARGKAAAAAAKTTPGKATAKTTSSRSGPAAKAPAKTAAKSGARAPAKSAPAKAQPAKTQPSRTGPAKPAGRRPAAAASTRRASKGSSRRGQQPLTVTLRFSDGKWTVEGHRGSRRLARASALRPGAVRTFAEVVDEPAIREAISEIVESGRAVVEERAEKLRAELEAAEASLSEYEARRR
jgi:hypothetical protein